MPKMPVVRLVVFGFLLILPFQNCSRMSAVTDATKVYSVNEPDIADVATETPGAPTTGANAGANTGAGANSEQKSGPLVAKMLLNDSDLLKSVSTAQSTIDMRNYFPKPMPGTALIHEFSHTNGLGGHVLYQLARYRHYRDQDYFLEDYAVTSSGEITWLFTWVYRINSSGVHEIMDTSPSWVTSQVENPIFHGLSLQKNVAQTHLAQGTIQMSGGALGTFWNQYWFNLVGVIDSLKLPGGEFSDVAVRVEQQTVQTTAGGVTNPRSLTRNRFYFAPGKGIIGIQWFDKDAWTTANHPFLYLTKSCLASASVYRCP